eukprot:gene9045-1142_t
MFKKKLVTIGPTNKTCILLQNENGPCSLISIVNILLIRNSKIVSAIPRNNLPISQEEIISILVDYILQKNLPNCDELIEILSNSTKGININIKFKDINSFEYTKEIDIFDVFGVSIVHGWLIDPQDELLYSKLYDTSYNQVIEKLIESHDDELKLFLESSQLSIYGLMKLQEELKNGSLFILFRNNHFSTLCKYQDQLYTLVTDEGYENEKNIVWERIQNEEGNTILCRGDFKPYSKNETEISNSMHQVELLPKQKVHKHQDDDFCLIS